MKFNKTNRRRFLAMALLCSPVVAFADAKWLEPSWVKTRRIRLGGGKPRHRLVHLTDVHHKGDRTYLLSVVEKVNALSPDAVCITGDLVEEVQHLEETLELVAKLKSPVYGVPGNHEYWCRAPADRLAKSFAATGGGWLLDQQLVTADGKLTFVGATCRSAQQPVLRLNPTTRNVLLMHYPAWVKKLHGEKFDLVLAGHSHGGQVRLPLYGPIFLPFGVEEYDLGLFHTNWGPLYVNPGLGWFPFPIRFNCRPEITLFEL